MRSTQNAKNEPSDSSPDDSDIVENQISMKEHDTVDLQLDDSLDDDNEEEEEEEEEENSSVDEYDMED